MPNRKKRLEKGIASIETAIEEHKQKIADATAEGDEGLVEYYSKEIKGMEDQIKTKKKGLNK